MSTKIESPLSLLRKSQSYLQERIKRSDDRIAALESALKVAKEALELIKQKAVPNQTRFIADEDLFAIRKVEDSK